MNHKALKTDGSSQMRSVAVLLIVAVVLPTVCLLWFMGRAIKNERLAIQQRLIDFYSGQADEKFVEFSRTYWNQFRDKAVEVDDTGPDDWFAELADGGKLSVFDGVLVYDEGGNLLYPVVSDRQQADHEYEYTEAEQLEFIDNDIAGAIEAYDKAAMSDEGLWTKAMAGKARCLKKAGKLADAGAVYKELAWPAKTRPDSDEYAAQSQIMLARIYQSIAHRDFYSTCEKIADERFSTLKIDTADRIFLLEELLEITAETGIAKQMSDSINEVENVIAHDKLSVSTVELLDGGRFEDWPDWTFRRLGDEPRLYGFRYQISNKIIVPLFTEDNAKDFWQAAVKAIEDEMVFCRVLDDRGDIVAGTPKYYAGGELIFGRQFMSLDLDPFFPGWKVDLYFFAGTFNEATKRQKIIYIWTAALVILVMLIVSGLAGKVMVKQARINRLKNDFVATVSHELKTPLASMRVLIDTIIEGNYRDQSQVREYLELVAKENKRLTGLIDNFLTFSRMERNKHAFNIVSTDAGEIAEDAAEAVRTRFEQNGNTLKITVDADAGEIKADHDAMVTVLVNLLNNAWKYSGDDKKIALNVYRKDGVVNFEVSDNGVGMNKRVVRKMFDRFYQADSSLARKAEGCGLGLSIVKFIVDAHSGTIEVESEAGKGTVFTVSLPKITE